jgi:hypothetical protein
MCIQAVTPLARGLEPAIVVGSPEAAAGSCPQARLEVRARRLNVLVGERAELSGVLEEGEARAPAGTPVTLERRAGRTWREVGRGRTGAQGRFSLSYVPREPGSGALRVAFPGDATAGAATRTVGRLEAFRLAEASWYGGGGSLACGGELTSATLGVANKTLPCGTLVTLRYGGRTIRVPVVDRGPYVEGREFDLTEATKRELGFVGTGEVWTIT